MAGRKTKYTPEVVERIVTALKLGSTNRIAAQYGGISEDTFYTWLNNKPEFSDAIKEAEAEGVVGLLARIKKEANEGSWQAAAWVLERRYPSDYGRQVVQQDTRGQNWETDAITDIRNNLITFEALAQAFDETKAKQLFTLAGVAIPDAT